NSLYKNSNTVMLLGNARETIRQVVEKLSQEPSHDGEAQTETDTGTQSSDRTEQPPLAAAVEKLVSAQKIIIIPGYGMALAQAQFKVVELGDLLASRGADVVFAIHPVAGRMPGHMNVLLAEAEVDYDKLVEMDDINPAFSRTDVALIFGACDVVNPAAMETQGTPISGMPILRAHEANNVVVCNFDANPGYSGVDNTLYTDPKTIMLPGDAAATAGDLIAGVKKA
ncbi:MAG TPA: NAD(P)(+) transhydrogenase (Re/Si-specific) subunit beta, partial [Desulfotignum sp.]|nr:NAD(P)(+) transhydrogenase (Re/Si-specific) subunit beta [Desulfotignum sp.]